MVRPDFSENFKKLESVWTPDSNSGAKAETGGRGVKNQKPPLKSTTWARFSYRSTTVGRASWYHFPNAFNDIGGTMPDRWVDGRVDRLLIVS
jgi:hypothetical protein